MQQYVQLYLQQYKEQYMYPIRAETTPAVHAAVQSKVQTLAPLQTLAASNLLLSAGATLPLLCFLFFVPHPPSLSPSLFPHPQPRPPPLALQLSLPPRPPLLCNPFVTPFPTPALPQAQLTVNPVNHQPSQPSTQSTFNPVKHPPMQPPKSSQPSTQSSIHLCNRQNPVNPVNH
jgi:hypothetical protein